MDDKHSLLQQYVAECKQDFNAKFKTTLQFKLSLQPHCEIKADYSTTKLLQTHQVLTG